MRQAEIIEEPPKSPPAATGKWLHDTAPSRSLHHARWKAGRRDLEVDIVSLDTQTRKPRFAIEIKQSDAIVERPGELRGLRELATRHRLSRQRLVTTRSYAWAGDLDGVPIEFAPVALHCYSIARNLRRVRDRAVRHGRFREGGVLGLGGVFSA